MFTEGLIFISSPTVFVLFELDLMITSDQLGFCVPILFLGLDPVEWVSSTFMIVVVIGTTTLLVVLVYCWLYSKDLKDSVSLFRASMYVESSNNALKIFAFFIFRSPLPILDGRLDLASAIIFRRSFNGLGLPMLC